MADAHTGQVNTSYVMMGCMTAIALAALVVAYCGPSDVRTPALLIASGIGGAMANSLCPPSGIASALQAAKSASTLDPTKQEA